MPTRISPKGALPMEDIPCDPVKGNEVPNTPGLHLVFLNTDTENAHTVTFITPAKGAGSDVEDVTTTLQPWKSGGVEHARICGGFSTAALGHTLQFIADSDKVTLTAYTKLTLFISRAMAVNSLNCPAKITLARQ